MTVPPINDKQRQLCNHIITGMPAGRAYELSGYKARGNAAEVEAGRTLKKPQVVAYLTSLRAEAQENAAITRDGLVGYLVGVIKAPFCDNVKLPSQLVAAKQLSELMGWNKPQELKVDLGDKLADIIRRVRGS